MTLKFLDQTGLTLSLALGYTWTPKGSGNQFEIPSRYSSQGKINLIGTLSLFGEEQKLEVRELEKNCNAKQVISYLNTLAQKCNPKELTVVVMDNAKFHKTTELKEMRPLWEAKGLFLRYLPPYCPFLNLIETVWRKVKGFLMPRRCYDSIPELRSALLFALKILNASFI